MKDISIEFLESKGIDTSLIKKKKGWFSELKNPIFSSCQLVVEEFNDILIELKSIHVSGESDIYLSIEYYETQINLINKWIYE